jgi:hypothetical protein
MTVPKILQKIEESYSRLTMDFHSKFATFIIFSCPNGNYKKIKYNLLGKIK